MHFHRRGGNRLIYPLVFSSSSPVHMKAAENLGQIFSPLLPGRAGELASSLYVFFQLFVSTNHEERSACAASVDRRIMQKTSWKGAATVTAFIIRQATEARKSFSIIETIISSLCPLIL